MATDAAQHYALLDELDARQNEVLTQLDDLNTRVETLLASCGVSLNATGDPLLAPVEMARFANRPDQPQA